MSRPYLVALAALTVFFAGCVSQEQYRRSLADNDNLRQQRDSLAENNRALQTDNERLQQQLADLSVRAKDADWIKEQKQRLAELLKGLDNGKLPTGVRTLETKEGIGFEVEGAVLFASGKAEITPSGQDTLRQLVKSIVDSGKEVRVDGHTDTDPIKHSSWQSNLELSAARALAVAQFLIQSGVPPERVAVAGFGQYHPAEPGETDAAKARNRRVEILMLSPS